MNQSTVLINTEYIRLDQMMKLTGLADTGGMAKMLIQRGYVLVNGECCTMRGKKLRPGDTVTVEQETVVVAADEENGSGGNRGDS